MTPFPPRLPGLLSLPDEGAVGYFDGVKDRSRTSLGLNPVAFNHIRPDQIPSFMPSTEHICALNRGLVCTPTHRRLYLFRTGGAPV